MGVVELLAALALGGSGASPCAATTVQYQATRVGIPWLRSQGVTANLFYYTGRALMDGRVNQSDGAVIYTGGRTPGAVTKILWRTGRGSGSSLMVTGRRLDGSGSFVERFSRAGRGRFPSIIRVPTAGCWRLSVRSGRVHASFVLHALDVPVQPVCEPTPVFRHVPHPRFGDITWMPASPRSAGIVAVGFVSTVPGAERALVYSGGRAPEGWSTKFLWSLVKPRGDLRLVGTRLDGAGSFRQVAQGAYSESPPVTGIVFPSIVEIPSPGCWGVMVRSGRSAGLVVFEAINPS